MSGDVHVQFCERLRGRFPWSTHLVIGCESEEDAHRLMHALPKRFARYGLTIHPEKSKMVCFKQTSKCSEKCGNGTFDFLGFTHYWARSRNGYWVIKRKTMASRHRRAIRNLFLYCRNNKHEPVKEQHKDLCAKLHGLYGYYGIRGNYRMLWMIYQEVRGFWKRWLGRRSRDGYVSWEKFAEFLDVWKLPRPRITKQV